MKMTAITGRAGKVAVGVALIPTVIYAFAMSAFATPPPTTPPYTSTQAVSDTRSFIGDLSNPTSQIMLAVAAGIIGITLLGWGIKTVYRKVTHNAHV